MDSSVSPKLELKQQTQASRKRKVTERSVVEVKMEDGKLKHEGPPSDSWCWRKYGQKPIKGSPYPRGYYRCSTSKSCSAKKQVERCRTDASVLVITYTSTHNHPSPSIHSSKPTQQPQQTQILKTAKQEDLQEEEKEEEIQSQAINDETGKEEEDQAGASEDQFHYLKSPLGLSSPSARDIMINQEFEKSHDMTLGFLFDEAPVFSCLHHNLMSCSTPKSEGNDFFDELEELPTASPFTSFMTSNYLDEMVPFVPY